MSWQRFFRRSQNDVELMQQIDHHLADEIEENLARGMSVETARRQALLKFGNPSRVRESLWQQNTLTVAENLWRDVKYAFRKIRRAPTFGVTVVGTLTLGIGAPAAMFTVVDHVLLPSLPYAHAERVVAIDGVNSRGETPYIPSPDAKQWKEQSRTLQQIALYFPEEERNFLQGNGSSMPIGVTRVSPNLFETLGVKLQFGQAFQPDQSSSAIGENANTIVLGDAAWKEAYGGDPEILGKTVKINNTSHTVVGVMPAGFRFPYGPSFGGEMPQVWLPFEANNQDHYWVIGRLARGVTASTAEAELDTLQKRVAHDSAVPWYRERLSSARVEMYRDTLVATDRKRALLALLAASGVLWLIAGMNVTSLLLARGAARQREIAMRVTLGASRWRVMQQLVVEGMLLSGVAAFLGILLALAAIRLFRSTIPLHLNLNLSYHVNLTILGALCGLTLLSALISSAWPAFLAAQAPIEPALRQGVPQTGRSQRHNRLGSLLVIGQIAMSLTLLGACGWLLRTIYMLKHVPLGFRTDHIIVARLAIPGYKFDHRSITANLYQPLLERVQHLPGVQTAGLLTWVPLSTGFRISTLLRDAGKSGNDSIEAQLQAASPEIQRVLGFQMLRGRYFDDTDTAASAPVVVVNRAFARIYLPDEQDPGSILGRKILILGRHAEVVGLLDDERQDSLMKPSQPEIEACIPQLPIVGSDDGTSAVLEAISMDLALRTQSPISSVIPELRAMLRKSDVELANTDVMTMDQIVADSYGSQRLAAHLLEVFGGAAMLLCIVGLYGLLSYIVSQRTHELGVRLALGAKRSGVLWMVLLQASGLVVAGILIGVVLALISGRLVRGFLYGVSTHDGWTLAIVGGLLLIIALIAAWQPARRAANVNPVEALRAE